MKKSKTNVSVVNNVGIRRSADIHIGNKGSFPSGDILDANAIQEAVDTAVAGALTTPGGLVSTIYIDESNSDGHHKVQITGDIAVNKDDQGNIIYIDGKPSTKTSSENVISWIRKNSRKVNAVYDKNLKVLKIMDPHVSGLGDDEVDCFM